jgi:hypothetical protein
MTEFRPDISYKGYTNIADIKRTEGFGYIHIGVGNPIGGVMLLFDARGNAIAFDKIEYAPTRGFRMNLFRL